MKKLLLSALLLSSIGSYAQTKKVLLEDFTGIWCQFCPNGTRGIENLKKTYPTNLIAMAPHHIYSASQPSTDLLAVPETPTIGQGLGGVSFPNGAIDRKFFSGTKVPMSIDSKATQWKNAVAAQVATTAIVSVGFANFREEADGTYKADVKVKFTSAPVSGLPLTLQVVILEDSIAAEGNLSQSNGPSANPSTPHYGLVSPLTSSSNGYWHNHTVRQWVGGTWGFTTGIFPATVVVGDEYTKEISFTIPTTGTIPGPNGWDKDQIHIVAFVAYNGTDHMANEKMVLNAEEISLKAFHKVSVGELSKSVSILNAYPNPAKTTDLVKVEYSITNSEVVTMTVYNMAGQRVAQPYVSNEVKGGHTIHWRPADNGLTPGMYLIEVSSASGKQVQRINIQ